MPYVLPSSLPSALTDFQEMCRTLEADILRSGLDVPESATIRRGSVMLPYLRHYAEELAAYAHLSRNPADWGFFVPDRSALELGGNATHRTSFAFVRGSADLGLGDPACVWETVERRLLAVERSLGVLVTETERRGAAKPALEERLTEPCGHAADHSFRPCPGRKRR